MADNSDEKHHPRDLLADVLTEIAETAERLLELRGEADGYIAQMRGVRTTCSGANA
jgi:hypothetical protein